MFEVYFSYEPRSIVLVDWENTEDVSINGRLNKAYATILYGKYTDWMWVADFYPNPLANSESSKDNVLELADMEDAIRKLFQQDL